MRNFKQSMRLITIVITALVIVLGLAAQSIEPVLADPQLLAQNNQPTPENPDEDYPPPVQLPVIEDEPVDTNSLSPLVFVVIIVAVALVFAFIGFFVARRPKKEDSSG